MFGFTTLRRQFEETAADVRAAKEEREEQEQRDDLFRQRAASMALDRHPELGRAELMMGGGYDHDSVCALAFVEQDRGDRAERRRRSAELAQRRMTQPIPVGRSHAEVLESAARWMDYVDGTGSP